jgi:hypothetical protein
MNRAIGTFTKGIATGMAVGTAVGMIARPMDIRKRARMKKNATKALHAVGEIISNAQNMMR